MYELDALAELNERYMPDGLQEVFLSPGLQFVAERWAFELSVQRPVVQKLLEDGPESDCRLVGGVRLRW